MREFFRKTTESGKPFKARTEAQKAADQKRSDDAAKARKKKFDRKCAQRDAARSTKAARHD